MAGIPDVGSAGEVRGAVEYVCDSIVESARPGAARGRVHKIER